MSASGLAIDDAAWASPWRGRRVRDKAVLSFGLLTCAVALPPWPGGVLAGVAALAVMLGPARVPGRLLARAMTAPLVFIAVGAATVLVTLSWDAGPRIGVAPSMIPTATALTVRALSGALAMFLLATTTPMIDLFAGLRAARIPDPLIEVASLTYRLVFVLLDSARTIREAQEARLGSASRAAAYRSMSGLVAAVLMRSWTRARRLEHGLAGRGYTDSLRTLDPPRHGSPRFLVASLALVGAVVASSLFTPALLGGPR